MSGMQHFESTRPPRVAIVGVGAIGGFVGTRLSAAGVAEVSALARGATLAALQREGLRLRQQDGSVLQAPVRAAAQAASLGVQDVVVIALKATGLASVAPTLAPLIGPQTLIWPAMNGVPWWLARALPALGGEPLMHVDPGGAIDAALPFGQVLGGVVHASCRVDEPGLTVHVKGAGLIVGEPLGGPSRRAQQLAALLAAAGFDATASDDVRRDLWYKLWGNLTTNPISAMCGVTVDRILDDPLVRAFATEVMDEARALGAAIGCPLLETPEDRHRITRSLGAFKTSMLQDAEAGRPLELDAIVGAVHEIGRRVGMPTPRLDALFGLARLQARQRGIYADPEAASAADFAARSPSR